MHQRPWRGVERWGEFCGRFSNSSSFVNQLFGFLRDHQSLQHPAKSDDKDGTSSQLLSSINNTYDKFGQLVRIVKSVRGGKVTSDEGCVRASDHKLVQLPHSSSKHYAGKVTYDHTTIMTQDQPDKLVRAGLITLLDQIVRSSLPQLAAINQQQQHHDRRARATPSHEARRCSSGIGRRSTGEVPPVYPAICHAVVVKRRRRRRRCCGLEDEQI